jgi:hypothetical protein
MLISQANITGITIPSSNVTNWLYTTTLPAENITGWLYTTTLPSSNITNWLYTTTLPAENITGWLYTTTLPWSNVTGFGGITLPQSNITGITIPAANVTGKDYSLILSQANITGITIPAANVTGKDYSLIISQANITGITFHSPVADSWVNNTIGEHYKLDIGTVQRQRRPKQCFSCKWYDKWRLRSRRRKSYNDASGGKHYRLVVYYDTTIIEHH